MKKIIVSLFISCSLLYSQSSKTSVASDLLPVYKDIDSKKSFTYLWDDSLCTLIKTIGYGYIGSWNDALYSQVTAPGIINDIDNNGLNDIIFIGGNYIYCLEKNGSNYSEKFMIPADDRIRACGLVEWDNDVDKELCVVYEGYPASYSRIYDLPSCSQIDQFIYGPFKVVGLQIIENKDKVNSIIVNMFEYIEWVGDHLLFNNVLAIHPKSAANDTLLSKIEKVFNDIKKRNKMAMINQYRFINFNNDKNQDLLLFYHSFDTTGSAVYNRSTIEIYDLETTAQLYSYEVPNNLPDFPLTCNSLLFDNSNKNIIFGLNNKCNFKHFGELYILDCVTNSVLFYDKTEVGQRLNQLAFIDIQNDGTLELVASMGSTLKIFNYKDPIEEIFNSDIGVSGFIYGDIDNDNKADLAVNYASHYDIRGDLAGSNTLKKLNLESLNYGKDLFYNISVPTKFDENLTSIVVGTFQDTTIESKKIFVTNCIGQVFCINSQNDSIIWQYTLSNNSKSVTMLLCDIEGDNIKELLIGSYDGFLYLLDARTGNLIRKSNDYGERIQYAYFRDWDCDGKMEIIFTIDNGSVNILAVDPETFSLLYKSEALITTSLGPAPSQFYDIDGDANEELIIMCDGGYLFILHPDTKEIEEKGKFLSGGGWHEKPHGIQIYDFDNDGIVEILIHAYCSRNLIYDIDTKELEKAFGISGHSSLINDIDNDGQMELIVANDGYVEPRGFMVYNLETFDWEGKSSFLEFNAYWPSWLIDDINDDGMKDIIVASDRIYIYRVKSNNTSVDVPYTKSIASFDLSQNYPNPFNSVTTITFSLKEDSNIQLNVYNTIGQKVATIVNEFRSAGLYKVKFDGSNLPSGIYIYKILTKSFSESRKMILLK